MGIQSNQQYFFPNDEDTFYQKTSYEFLLKFLCDLFELTYSL